MEVLLVTAPDPELDAEDAERPVRQLRAEIAGLDVESIRPGSAGTAPGSGAPLHGTASR